MEIDSKKLNEVAALMENHGLTRVRISEDDGKTIELERTREMAAPAVAPLAASPVPPAAAVATPAPVAAAAPVVEQSHAVNVTAPMVGVFYAAPSPDAEPFVTVGSTVHAGDTLCIIEAMKLMNEVVAETDGIVTEICAVDGDLVEFGACIMKIDPTSEA